MATITYEWVLATPSYFLNDREVEGTQSDPAITALSKGGFLAAWEEPGSGLNARVGPSNGQPGATEFEIDTTPATYSDDLSIATLKSGACVAVWGSIIGAAADIQGRMFDRNGAPLGSTDIPVVALPTHDSDPFVAALADGGYVVSWSRDAGGGNYDLRSQIFNANGSERTNVFSIDSETDLTVDNSSVAGLANGNFVVAWEQGSVVGDDNNIYFMRHTAGGSRIDVAPVAADFLGNYNDDLRMIALQDGGFAMAYQSDGWPLDGGDDITLAIYNANGSVRTNVLANFQYVEDDQGSPMLTQLSNGYIVVGWTDDSGDAYYQAFNPDGFGVGDALEVNSSVYAMEIAATAGNFVVNVRQTGIGEPGQEADSFSIRSSVHQLVRTTTGGNASQTHNGDNLVDLMLGMGGKDKINGLGGKDTLDGGIGDDVLRGGGDKDLLIGGLGADRYVYSDITQSRIGPGADNIRGFEPGLDLIDLDGIDAKAGVNGDQAFKLITGPFTAEGQIRLVQDGKDTIVQLNTTGEGGADMEIVLKNVHRGDIDAADFVL